jgi:AraC-like DNA-binding protein
MTHVVLLCTATFQTRIAVRLLHQNSQMFSELIIITDTEMADRAAASGWCVDALAENCGVSVSTLERIFHETKGQCPREWMTAERMRHARQLLERGGRISDVAEVLCYGHPENFCIAFVKYHGYPPREHRPGKWKEDGSPQSAVRSPKSKVQSPKSPIMACTGSGNDNSKSKFNSSKLPVGESFLDRDMQTETANEHAWT